MTAETFTRWSAMVRSHLRISAADTGACTQMHSLYIANICNFCPGKRHKPDTKLSVGNFIDVMTEEEIQFGERKCPLS